MSIFCFRGTSPTTRMALANRVLYPGDFPRTGPHVKEDPVEIEPSSMLVLLGSVSITWREGQGFGCIMKLQGARTGVQGLQFGVEGVGFRTASVKGGDETTGGQS